MLTGRLVNFCTFTNNFKFLATRGNPFRHLSSNNFSTTTQSPPPSGSPSTPNKRYEEYGKFLTGLLPKYIQKSTLYKDELTLFVDPKSIPAVVAVLRDHNRCQFKQVVDICGVDYPGREHRFEVVYHLLSIQFNTRLRLKTFASETSTVPS